MGVEDVEEVVDKGGEMGEVAVSTDGVEATDNTPGCCCCCCKG